MTCKTPVTYYGGKQRLAKWIVSHMPEHRVYVEPFFGGGAVLFAKPRAKHEIVNDLDSELTGMWKALRDDPELHRQLLCTPYAEDTHAEAKRMKGAAGDTPWAKYVRLGQAFGTIEHGGWCRSMNSAAAWPRKMDRLPAAAERLRGVVISNEPATKCIARFRDTAGCVIYCDPPYVGADMGDYGRGFDLDALNKLIAQLDGGTATALVSCYSVPGLAVPTAWYVHRKSTVVSANHIANKSREELLLVKGAS